MCWRAHATSGLTPPAHPPTVQAVYQSSNAAVGWSPGGSREVLLGVLASDARVAVRALRDWCQALGLPYMVPECKVGGLPLPGMCLHCCSSHGGQHMPGPLQAESHDESGKS